MLNSKADNLFYLNNQRISGLLLNLCREVVELTISEEKNELLMTSVLLCE